MVNLVVNKSSTDSNGNIDRSKLKEALIINMEKVNILERRAPDVGLVVD